MGRDAAQTEDGRYRLLVEAVTDYAMWVGGLPNDEVLVLASGADGALCSVVTPASSRASYRLGCQCPADLVISAPAIDG